MRWMFIKKNRLNLGQALRCFIHFCNTLCVHSLLKNDNVKGILKMSILSVTNVKRILSCTWRYSKRFSEKRSMCGCILELMIVFSALTWECCTEHVFVTGLLYKAFVGQSNFFVNGLLWYLLRFICFKYMQYIPLNTYRYFYQTAK